MNLVCNSDSIFRMRHVPVLLNEVVESLQLNPGMNIVDCTLGDAGHSEMILEKISPNGKVLGIDVDPESLLRAKQSLYKYGERVHFVRDNFVHLQEVVQKENFGPVNGILMDFGWSSPQFEDRGRGFSLHKNEPLNMRYDAQSGTGEAKEIVNSSSVAELEKIFREYGEEKWSRDIAEAIGEQRKNKNIETTQELREIVLNIYRKKLHSTKEVPWIGGLDPATRVFQALRIAVNDELGVIKAVLPQATEVLAQNGRLAVITFHSLEDRIVKHYFKSLQNKNFKIITPKPIECGKDEYDANPRARSAKLRVIQKL